MNVIAPSAKAPAPRVLFYVMHLQGIGHVVRASRISAELAAQGFAVTLVLGGMPLDAFHPVGVEIVQLPPLRMAPDSYRVLLKDDGTPIDTAYEAARADVLASTLAATQPDVVMIEAYPFDRPQMHFELVPFLEKVVARAPRPVVVSSIRDILQWKDKPERDAVALQTLERFFDKVLIHGDRRLATLGQTFRHADAIANKVHYTGIVAPPPWPPLPTPLYDVIVTAGGGTTGKRILEVAIAAKPRSRFAQARWLVAIGHNIPEETARAVRCAGAEVGIEVVDFLPDLGRHLMTASLAISQCGYNTAVDLLQARCPALLCPYAGIRQNEQLNRAERLADAGLAALLPEDQLTVATLLDGIERAVGLGQAAVDIDLDGAAETGRLLKSFLAC